MGNNILIKIKRFFQNKNTVTIICVLAGILVLYIGYNWRVGSSTEPISIPYAKNTLSSRHTITREDIGYVEVASTVLEKMPNIIRNSAQLIGKEVIYGNTIQMNSFFYNEDITDAEKNIENYAYEIPEGYSPIHLDVDFHSTYGNAMYPGNYIDLWFSDADESGRLIYGKFIKSFQILDVVDSDGNSVFETNAESRTPDSLIFAVSDDMRLLIEAAMQVGELVPVPRNKTYSANPGATEVASMYLQNYVLSNAVIISENSTQNATLGEGETNE